MMAEHTEIYGCSVSKGIYSFKTGMKKQGPKLRQDCHLMPRKSKDTNAN